MRQEEVEICCADWQIVSADLNLAAERLTSKTDERTDVEDGATDQEIPGPMRIKVPSGED
jgi:hypothetical protein